MTYFICRTFNKVIEKKHDMHLDFFIHNSHVWLFTLFAVSMTTSILRFCAAMASNSSSSSPTSHASLVMLSNSWKVVAFFGLPGVAGGGLLPALIRLQEKDIREQKTIGKKISKGGKDWRNWEKVWCSYLWGRKRENRSGKQAGGETDWKGK